ncbi:cyclic nucleotide-binding domain-containing protein [Sneathiella chinensis]|uniref:Nitrogen fixation regulation protein FixK n=1 Tax=Sneathiella chinensis TaxID=349750 RepID=A0ABQ5U3W5_9PROT|nr:cyclic nucleotide-binding domain-containing protein [Sneathiella chinensis]GLQ05979.1 nitrogen fixation regulation protein FixK [Sneathiella chinensis]
MSLDALVTSQNLVQPGDDIIDGSQSARRKFFCGRGNRQATDFCSSCDAHEKAICSELEGDELLEFGKFVTHKKFSAGQSLFAEFDDAKYFYTVVSGDVRLSRFMDDGRRQILGFKSTGDFIGLSASGHYTCDAEAISDTLICQFSVANLEATLEESHAIKSRLLQMMETEVIALQNHMLLLGRKTPLEKISNFLIGRIAKAEGEGEVDYTKPVDLSLPMSRTDIADYLGLTIETVSRTFTKLRKQDVIALETAQNVRVLDYYQLEALANGEN